MGKYAGFKSVELERPQKSTFDLSHTKRLTTGAGFLTPVLVSEAIPGDYFRGSTELLLRMAPLLAPIYDDLIVFVHFFFVPNRLLWENWEQFITGGRLGVGIDPVTAPVRPFISVGGVMAADPTMFGKGQLADFLGVPILGDADPVASNWNPVGISAMPFLAYQLIWAQYYRDRNFTTDDFEQTFPLPDGNLSDALPYMGIRIRNWMHDYFHSSLPFTQRGTEVLIPMEASVSYLQQSLVKRSSDGVDITDPDADLRGTTLATYGGNLTSYNSVGPSATEARIENIDNISNGSSTINDFRTAYALQVWYERNAIAGSRYTESIQAHFGVRPQDSRLQRAEFLGGGRIPIKISEVVSTAWSNDGTADVPLANMAGHGVTYGNTNHLNYFCAEHGFIMGILSIMSPPSYHQGLPNMFRRETFLDYPWPTFAKLGEQQVNKAEIFANPANCTADAEGLYPLFGYQSRYCDWKWIPNTSHGEFHDTLLFWTLTSDFADTPVLNESFNYYDIGIQDRIFAVGGTPNFWIYLHNRLNVKRSLPYFGTPNNLGFK